MSTTFTVNGTNYTWPTRGGQGWATQVNNLIQALTLHTLQKSGGLFTLTANIDLGANYGILSKHFTSRTTGAAATGAVRLANLESVSWRNFAGGADLALIVSAANRLSFDGVAVPTVSSTDSLTNKTLTDATNHISAAIIDSGTIPDARIQVSGVTQHQGSIAHQSISGAGTNTHTQIDTHIASTSNPHSVAHSQLSDKGTNTHAQLDTHVASMSNPHTTTHAQLSDKGSKDHAAIDSHIANTLNPHSVTKAQVSLGNCDNTSDVNKPVSTAQATAIGLKADTSALTAHTGNTSNPHSVTQAQVMGALPLTIAENTTPANPAAGYYKVYPKADGKLYKLDSAGVEQMVGGGGGLVTERKSADFTAAAGKHYLVDLSGGNVIATLPAGATESVVAFSTYGNTSNAYRLNIARASTDVITYNGTDYTDVTLLPSNGWCQLMYTATGTRWIVDDQASFVAGTFAGNLTVTGFTSLGSGNIALKCKLLGGNTGAANTITTVAHGLTGSKIMGHTCKIFTAANDGVDSSYGWIDATYKFACTHDGTNFYVNVPTGSTGVATKAFDILVWYIA